MAANPPCRGTIPTASELAMVEAAGGTSPRARVQDAADGIADAPLKFRLSHPWFLEVELIEHRVGSLRHAGCRPDRATRTEGHTRPYHATEPIGAQECSVPGDGRPPIVTGDDGRLYSKRVHQGDHVANEMEERVPVDGLRPISLAVATHVGRDGVESGLCER